MINILGARPNVGYFYTGRSELSLVVDHIKELKIEDYMSVPFVMEETDRERYRFPEQMTRIITLQHRFSSGKHSRDCGRLPKKTGL